MNRFMSALLCFTLAGLSYVYLEVEAVTIGYTIRKQEEQKTMGMDRARALNYNIAMLKSPHNLERKLAAQKIVLESPRSWNTLVMADPNAVKANAAAQSLTMAPLMNKFFVGTASAEARERASG